MSSLYEEIHEAPETTPVRRVSVSVNGEKRDVDVEPRLLLAHLLRQGFKLTGTHTGPGGTGNSVRISGHESWLLDEEGLIAESLGHYDEAEYRRQLEQGAGDGPALR